MQTGILAESVMRAARQVETRYSCFAVYCGGMLPTMMLFDFAAVMVLTSVCVRVCVCVCVCVRVCVCVCVCTCVCLV